MVPHPARLLKLVDIAGGSANGMSCVRMTPATPSSGSIEEIADYLGSGNKPDGDVAGGLMGEVIDGTLAGYKDLSKADRVAIAQYLKSIPPVRNKIGK